MTVTIPASIEEATERLDGIEALLTARGWERAAIVYAFTEDAQGRRTDLSRKREKLSMSEFAALGIAGLRKPDTVALYRKLWAEHGDPTIGPGSTVELPAVGFPPTRTGTNGDATPEGMTKRIEDMVAKHGADAVAAEVLAQAPEAVEDVVAQTPAAVARVLQRSDELRPVPPRRPKVDGPIVALTAFEVALDDMLAALAAVYPHLTDLPNRADVVADWTRKLTGAVDWLADLDRRTSHA